ncbi:FadR/GntR family transcriptional regulator [Nonlabens xiamenensis]|uniref:FadR/GntR family transcriptional regulator n=1 Tax=Nonlabens xiamenensis TaxID=2341043 RepID=UPI000F60883D|nr:FadR/GntR family transcriptional regulator [Nonlabens xiamenensis]
MLEHGLQIVKPTVENENDFDRDEVVTNIKALIEKHQLEEGDRLPSERKLSEKLGVTRNQIRAAIQKLEFYGIIKTMPQSGSVVTGLGNPSINTMMTDVLDLDTPDFKSLVETRVILETHAVRLAAIRRTEASMKEIQRAHDEFVERILNKEPSLIEDIKFHVSIVKASGNTVLYGLMQILVPDIIGHFNKEYICDRTQGEKLITEHQAMVDAIRMMDESAAGEALDIHFTSLRDYIEKK